MSNKNNKAGWTAGIYRPDGNIAKLWEELSDEKPHSKAELTKKMLNNGIKAPADRWLWIRRDGKQHNKANQTFSWRLIEDGDIVRMEKKAL
jgi:hypothetical protein